MAYISDHLPSRTLTPERADHLLKAIRRGVGTLVRTRRNAATLRTLAQLDDHVLRDIGLDPQDVRPPVRMSPLDRWTPPC